MFCHCFPSQKNSGDWFWIWIRVIALYFSGNKIYQVNKASKMWRWIRGKIILVRPNRCWWVQILFNGSNLFWTDPKYRSKSFWTCLIKFNKSNDLDPSKTNCTFPKQIAPVQNDLNGPKSFWTYRRTRHKCRIFLRLNRPIYNVDLLFRRENLEILSIC